MKKFKTHNEKDINFTGTHYLDFVNVNYKSLVEIFGKPIIPFGGDGKVDAEWVIEFEDGTIGTIYNYKTGKNYLGSAGTPTKKITHWHIGGKDPIVVCYINDVLKKHLNI